jgi:uracil-DNA glycosylase
MKRFLLFARSNPVDPVTASQRMIPVVGSPAVTSGPTSATERRELLKEVYEQARGCVACQLHQTRTQVVFGAGNADADLMFIGEAPGADEDRLGLPFVGRAGKLLDQLLAEIGLDRNDVFIANTLKCRPPSNRDPYPNEIESCSGYLRRQVELIQPKVICTLGNFSTKLLRADSTGISRLHGRDEVRTIGTRAIRLLPLYHPAAALYTPSNLQTLRDDFARIPELLALEPPPQPEPVVEPEVEVEVDPATEPEPEPERGLDPEPEQRSDPAPDPGDSQLGLF